MEYDYIIVGSGTAGCFLAANLPGNKIVLETGILHETRTMKAAVQVNTKKLEYLDRPYTIGIPYCVGGGSFVNGKFCHQGFASDYNHFAKSSKISEDLHSFLKDFIVKEELNEFCSKMAAYLVEKKYPELKEVLLPEKEGFIVSSFLNIKSFAFLLDGIPLETNCRVESILHENGVANGVKCSKEGKTIEFKGKNIVLCAGALNSPVILNQSGLKHTFGEKVTDHYKCTIAYKIPFEARNTLYFEQLSWFLASKVGGPIDCQVQVQTQINKSQVSDFELQEDYEDCAAIHIGYCLNLVKSTGGIIQTGQTIEYNFGPTKEDCEKLASLITRVEDIMKESGLLISRLAPKNDSDLLEFIKKTVCTVWHYGGTCSVGHEISPQFQVPHLKNAYVADSSTFALNPRINTMGPTLLHAALFADMQNENYKNLA